MTKIKYPEAVDWLQYKYDNENRVKEVVGFTALNGITYEADGALKSITYGNGVSTGYSYDSNRRLNNLQTSMAGSDILRLGYTYDNTNNITRIDDSGKMKTYEYDKNNQLTRSITPGKFLEDQPTGGSYGLKIGDYLGASWMDFMPVLNGLIGLDYNSSSIGIDFGSVAAGVKKIVLMPDKAYQTHRVIERTLNLYTSTNNLTYQAVPRNNYEFVKDDQGIITITLKERLATRFLKVHVKFDERQTDFNAKDKATFLNELAKMLRVYQEATSRTEEFQYDSAGNRSLQRITLVQTNNFNSVYYTNSDRLKTDGKFAFKYDEAGNLVEKGNKFVINGDTVTFTKTGEGAEYWQYEFDLLNRLIKITKNGTIVSEYGYDPEGLRVVKKAKGETTHYVFEGTEPIFEKRISTGKAKSYVYALGRYLARVDGVIGDTQSKKYFYHTDHLGSIRAVTDQTGKVVFQADHLPFGQRFGESGDFDEWHSFTGKEFDPDTGLHYFNARWYDAEIGRFISEDPVMDPNNPNLYSYCSNNPLTNIDPTGLREVGGATPPSTTSPTDDDNNDDGATKATPKSSPSSSSSSSSSSSNPTSKPEPKVPENPNPSGGQTPGQGSSTKTTYYPDRSIKSQTIYNPDGSKQSTTYFNKNGSVKSYETFSDGKITNRYQFRYSKDGTIQDSMQTHFYRDGAYDKKYTIYNGGKPINETISKYSRTGDYLGGARVSYRTTDDYKTYTVTTYYDRNRNKIKTVDGYPNAEDRMTLGGSITLGYKSYGVSIDKWGNINYSQSTTPNPTIGISIDTTIEGSGNSKYEVGIGPNTNAGFGATFTDAGKFNGLAIHLGPSISLVESPVYISF